MKLKKVRISEEEKGTLFVDRDKASRHKRDIEDIIDKGGNVKISENESFFSEEVKEVLVGVLRELGEEISEAIINPGEQSFSISVVFKEGNTKDYTFSTTERDVLQITAKNKTADLGQVTTSASGEPFIDKEVLHSKLLNFFFQGDEPSTPEEDPSQDFVQEIKKIRKILNTLESKNKIQKRERVLLENTFRKGNTKAVKKYLKEIIHG